MFFFFFFFFVVEIDNTSRNVKLYTNAQNYTTIALTVPSSVGLYTEAARALYDFRAEAAETAR